MASVAVQTPFKQHTANGVTTVFAYDFHLLAEGDLSVSVSGVVKTLNVDYTVSGLDVQAGGSVTFAVAPASTSIVLLSREIALERITEYQTLGDLKAVVINPDFNRLWMALQGLGADIGGTVRSPYPEQLVNLPALASRANRTLGFDSLGQPTVVTPVAGSAAAVLTDLANSSDVSKADALVAVLRSGTGAVATTQHAINERGFSVDDFGAVGDGTTNDRAAIQLCIDAVAAAGAGVLKFTAGKNYLVNGISPSSPSTVGSGVRFVFYYTGTASFRFEGYGARLTRTDVSYGTGVDEFFKIITTGTVEFEGLHFEGHGTMGSTAGAGRPIVYMIHLETTSRARIKNLTSRWAGIVELYGCVDTVIEGCRFLDSAGLTNTFKHGASTYTDGLVIRDNHVYRSEFDVIDLNDATRNFRIDGNCLTDCNTRNEGTTDWDEFIDVGGTSLPVYNGQIVNNIIRETVGLPTRGIYIKQYSSHIVIANNVIAWDAGSKRAENDGITMNFAGDDITITDNQITGFSAGIITRNNPNGLNYVISGNKIRDCATAGIWFQGFNSLISGNHIVNGDAGITGTLYGIRVDDPSGCTLDGNLVDLGSAAGSFGIMVTGSNSLKANAVKSNTVLNCGIGIRHFGGSASYVGNNIQCCYGGAFSATNGGKSVHFVDNYCADNFRSTSPETVGGVVSTSTVEMAEIVRVVCSGNIVTENALNVEPGTIRLTAGGAGHTLIAIGNMCTVDTTAPAITSPVAYTSVSTGNNIPAYAIVP